MAALRGKMRRQRRAFFYIIAAGVLWALQPVYLLIVGREIEAGDVGFLFWNYAGRVVFVAVLALAFGNRKRFLVAVRDGPRRRALARTWVLDGLLISGSYLLLLSTRDTANLLASAILFETWPVFAALILAAIAPQERDRSGYAIVAGILFLCGFLGVVHHELRAFWSDGSVPSLRALASGALMGAAVVVVQRYLRSNPYFGTLRQMSWFLLGRAVVALVGIGVYVGITAEPIWLERAAYYVPVLAFGMLVSLNSFLYHLGSRNASSNVVSLGVLISPTLAPVFLFVLGYGALTQGLLAGSACILAGIAISARDRSMSPQFLVVAVLTILIGSAILFIPGIASPDFDGMVQTVSIFYGLLQAAHLSTLVTRHDAVSREVVDFQHSRSERRFEAARLHLKRVATMQRDATSVTELILLSFVGGSTVVLLVWLRDASVAADAVAYVVAITITYLLAISWVYLNKIATVQFDAPALRRRVLSRQVAERSFSYVLVTLLLIWFLGLVLLKPVLPV